MTITIDVTKLAGFNAAAKDGTVDETEMVSLLNEWADLQDDGNANSSQTYSKYATDHGNENITLDFQKAKVKIDGTDGTSTEVSVTAYTDGILDLDGSGSGTTTTNLTFKNMDNHSGLLQAAYKEGGIESLYLAAIKANRSGKHYDHGYMGTVSGIADSINQMYGAMLDMAAWMADNPDAMSNIGDLTMMQTYMSLLKEAIATVTAIGNSVNSSVTDAMKTFAQKLNQG
ncbi:MAG: hypothetical protein AABZ14_08705 [Candidatus Margulisiibacteriota bacterium]